jgi:hypothetical protein
MTARTFRPSSTCNAPRRSSNQGCLASPKLVRAEIAESLVRALGVVPTASARDDSAHIAIIAETMLPRAFSLEVPEEPFNHAVLLRRVRREECLTEPIVPTGPAKPSALEGSSLSDLRTGVGPCGRRVPNRARQASSSACSASLARPRKANSWPTTARMRHVHSPPLIAGRGDTASPLNSRPRRDPTLMNPSGADAVGCRSASDSPLARRETAGGPRPVDSQTTDAARSTARPGPRAPRPPRGVRARARVGRVVQRSTARTRQIRRSDVDGRACFTRRTSSRREGAP